MYGFISKKNNGGNMTKETNSYIWDKVKHTNPNFTKPFPAFGKTLTTIDPMYQIMIMTNQFGPVGEGWNYKVNYTYTDKVVFAEVSVAHKQRHVHAEEKTWDYYGPISSAQSLYKKNGALDDEAPKKAMTDALTKAFSHLGVSADVFLGLFDNNKYVSDMKTKFAQEKPKVADTNLVNFEQKGKK